MEKLRFKKLDHLAYNNENTNKLSSNGLFRIQPLDDRIFSKINHHPSRNTSYIPPTLPQLPFPPTVVYTYHIHACIRFPLAIHFFSPGHVSNYIFILFRSLLGQRVTFDPSDPIPHHHPFVRMCTRSRVFLRAHIAIILRRIILPDY